jgi:hypothetical protein
LRQRSKTITKIFKNTRIKIAFRTQNTRQNILQPHIQTDKYSRSSIYKLKCLNCTLKYIGQKQEEHSILDIKNTVTPSEKQQQFQIFETYTKHRACIQNNNRYYGCRKGRKEGQTFEYLGKMSHL